MSSEDAIHGGTPSGRAQPIESAKRLSLAAEDLDWLERKAAEIADLHIEVHKWAKRCFDGFVSLLESTSLAGAKLTECKQRLKHGQWLPWLEKYPRIHPRMAQRYMWFARHWTSEIAPGLEELRKTTSMSDLERLQRAKAYIAALHVAERVSAGEKPAVAFITFDRAMRWAGGLVKPDQVAHVRTWPDEERAKLRETIEPLWLALA